MKPERPGRGSPQDTVGQDPDYGRSYGPFSVAAGDVLGEDSFGVVEVLGDERLVGVFGGADQLQQAVGVVDSGIEQQPNGQ